MLYIILSIHTLNHMIDSQSTESDTRPFVIKNTCGLGMKSLFWPTGLYKHTDSKTKTPRSQSPSPSGFPPTVRYEALFLCKNLPIFQSNKVTETLEIKMNVGTTILNITVRIRTTTEIQSLRRAMWRGRHLDHCPNECKGLSYRWVWFNKILILMWFLAIYQRENAVRKGKF